MPSSKNSKPKPKSGTSSIRSRQDLKKLQQLMARTVMRPLTVADRMQLKTKEGKSTSKVVNTFIRPNDRLTSFERLEIYNRQYWFRLKECFYEDFPGVRSVIGENRFARMAQAYLEENPSRSFTLRNLGARLPAWMKKNPAYLGPMPDLALDMVRLEWAHIESFDLEAKKPMALEKLAGKSPARIRLNLQPHLQLLDLHYPADNLLIQTRSGSAGETVASNAVSEPRKSKKLRAVGAGVKAEQIFLAVHRTENNIYYKRLDREAFQFLKALRQGKNLIEATVSAFRGSRHPIDSRPTLIQQCVAHAAALNWFCEK